MLHELNKIYEKPSHFEMGHAIADLIVTLLETGDAASIDFILESIDLKRVGITGAICVACFTRLAKQHFAKRDAFVSRAKLFIMQEAPDRYDRLVVSVL